MLDDTSKSEYNFEIKDLYESIIRNNKFFLKILAASVSLSLIYGFSKAKTWEGEFQIVLQNKSNNNSELFNSLNAPKILTDSFNITSKNNIATEVGILKSPSTLMPVFLYYKDQKNQKNINLKNLTLKDWINKRLLIELTRKTNILNIKFNDKDKSLIVPILDKISKTYQDYSNKSRLRDLELSSLYLNQQTDIYKKKSNESLKEAQEFAINQDLFFPNQTSLTQTSPKSIESRILGLQKQSANKAPILIPNISIEDTRIKAVNDLKEIDSQLTKIRNLKGKPELLEYIFYSIPSLNDPKNFGISNKLEKVELELISNRTIFKENDEAIQKLIKKKNLLTDLLKNKAIGYLEAKKLVTKAKLDAATRPKGVFLKYKELLRKAGRDETTLINLEDDLLTLKLNKAKQNDPWELITSPTLNPYPIAPNKKRILILGTLFGLMTGVTFSILKDYKSNVMFNIKSIYRLTNKRNILNLREYSKEEWQVLISSIFSKLNLENKKIAIQTTGFISTDNLKIFKKILNSSDLKEKYLISDNISELKDCDYFCILSTLGFSKINDLRKSLKLIEYQNKEKFVLIVF